MIIKTILKTKEKLLELNWSKLDLRPLCGATGELEKWRTGEVENCSSLKEAGRCTGQARGGLRLGVSLMVSSQWHTAELELEGGVADRSDPAPLPPLPNAPASLLPSREATQAPTHLLSKFSFTPAPAPAPAPLKEKGGSKL